MLVPPNMVPSKNYLSTSHYLSQGTIMSNYSCLCILEVSEPGYTQFRVERYLNKKKILVDN